MSDTVKLIIELPIDKYLSVKTNMINDFIYDAVKHGIPLDDVPSVENKGEWIKDHEVNDVAENAWYTVYRCSECGCLVESWKQSNFCPNCGADMRGEKDA